MSAKSTKQTKPTAKRGRASKPDHVPVLEILLSPENDQLYRPVDPTDPEIIALANSIREHGVLEPLILTADRYIVSGHRRFAAAELAGLETVPVRWLQIRRVDDLDAFVKLLREHNRQREKTNDERLREEIVSINADDAYSELQSHREAVPAIESKPLAMGEYRARSVISDAKRPMLDAVQSVINERREFWPLSDRQIHYALLNDPPLIHARKPDSVYRNDLASYKRLVDLLTRARLDGSIEFESIGDETRPVQVWDVHPTVRSFARRELADMFRSYWRDLMQSQPNHIELVGEKNTVGSILRPVAAQYTIPLTTGRGYCSLPPRHAMAERFASSGKEQLVLLIVSDFDPDGESIAESFARSMRDDFRIDNVHPIKVALTAEQVAEHNLPPMLKAKQSSSRCEKFVDEHGDDVFELEALPPETLQEIVRSVIEGVIDRDAFAAESATERDDSVFLEQARRKAINALRGLDLGGDADA